MKVKTSITLSKEILEKIDEITRNRGRRSAFIEQAVRNYIKQKHREVRDKRDREILNQHADELNKEAGDVLSYQVEL